MKHVLELLNVLLVRFGQIGKLGRLAQSRLTAYRLRRRGLQAGLLLRHSGLPQAPKKTRRSARLLLRRCR